LTDKLSVSQKFFTILLPFCGGYFLSYLFRSTNAVIAPHLVDEFNTNAQQLGILTSSYLFAFAVFQIPLGILLDKYGARKVQIFLMIFAGLGSLMFSYGNSILELTIARAIIGFGVAGCLMSTFKIITVWYNKNNWSILYGLCLSSGGLGAIVATKPLYFIVDGIGWRSAFMILAVLCFVISFIIWAVTPEKESVKEEQNILFALKEIYSSKLFWRIAPLAGISGGTGLAIQGLWAGEWLRDVARLDQNNATNMLLILNVSLLVGMIITGFIPNILKRFKLSQIDIFFVITLILLLGHSLLTFEVLPVSPIPWILLGISANGAILAYSWLNTQFPISYSGRTSTALNLSLFLCGFVLQYAIGWIINFWDKSPDNTYPAISYSVSFGVLIILQIMCIIIFFSLRPKSNSE
jgi:MFS family permease